jgi:hypothetical protein
VRTNSVPDKDVPTDEEFKVFVKVIKITNHKGIVFSSRYDQCCGTKTVTFGSSFQSGPSFEFATLVLNTAN